MADAPPKLFVSYAWSSADHEAYVVALATQLRESGIDVLLDKWDLREGQDANAFMERMVADPAIHKVVLVCDRVYAEKADRRTGGVGTEAQIISPKVYSKTDQTKFVAIVVERDPQGRPYLPVYYTSRIFVDLSDETTYAENFERLLRWAFDRPFYAKPDIGPPPEFLGVAPALQLPTGARARRATELMRSGKDTSDGALKEYLTTLAAGLERIRIAEKKDPFDDQVIESIESFLPYRNEWVEVFQAVAIYRDNQTTRTALHRFFESLIPYYYPKEGTTQYDEWDFDNFVFVIHELFLYALGIYLQHERFDAARSLLETQFYVPSVRIGGRTGGMRGYGVFRQHMRSLEHRNDRLKLRRLSLRADTLKQRVTGVPLTFEHIMQADFVCFMRDRTELHEGTRWWPETLLHAGFRPGPFEIFARSQSLRYFSQVGPVIGVTDKAVLVKTVEEMERQPTMPRWEFDSFSPRHLMDLQNLGTVA